MAWRPLQCPITVPNVDCDGVRLALQIYKKGGTDMNKQLLRDTLETLKNVRAEVQGTVEDSVIDDIDIVIKKLEDATNSPYIQIDPIDVLMLLGKVIENLPEIAEAIKRLMR
jgi:hypothetical protein